MKESKLIEMQNKVKAMTNIIQQLINGNLLEIDIHAISLENKKKISKFLYQKLCFHFEGFESLKSFRVIKDIFYS